MFLQAIDEIIESIKGKIKNIRMSGQQKNRQIVLVEGKLVKIIHREGQGNFPSKGQELYTLYKGTLQDGTEFDSIQDKDDPFKFILGNDTIIKGWHEGFATMRKGEKASFICSPEYAYGQKGFPPRIPPNATLCFTVELLDFKDKKKVKWDMSSEQKLEQAGKIKELGNQHLKKGELTQAIAAYKQGIEYICFQESQQAKYMTKILNLNISQAYLRAKEYSQCIKNAGKVLKDEPQNHKALYRRGVAYARNKDFQKAMFDLQQLLKLDPLNEGAKKQLLEIVQARKKSEQKQKKTFSAMLSTPLYES